MALGSEKSQRECNGKNVMEGYAMRNSNVYRYLANAIDYPGAQYVGLLSECQSLLEREYPEALPRFSKLYQHVLQSNAAQVEESYTKTFDVNAVCHLDVGYQLFGEDYKRGALLVELSRVQREAGNDTGTELADHLPNLLRLIPKVKSPDERQELVKKLILPALQKMCANFAEGSENVYCSALSAISTVLETDFGFAEEFLWKPSVSGEIPAEEEKEGTYV